ncbi:hypothetical protein CAOG_01433 [Capsaspora owczarzaki ATCC 30864]|uniref:Uncharacterized protein n=1 Tax=Capsaspora owczarzaki (strain ATCC 30864) TaxID=595528 RepID=A0A0D2VJB5_CAPO3|nr:hypothetical protein CAOG_01433 [Capsaspora owczarzaki ATCC 30864]KJE90057.1 hypothetical protein CAOG_001433 [Capsaspora owczarzaki ATCC 30864]|eukprot:XP_004349953.1 hypothetical protein CAOG_01433 [Capsaspora owczarzaki ATCC 30864]
MSAVPMQTDATTGAAAESAAAAEGARMKALRNVLTEAMKFPFRNKASACPFGTALACFPTIDNEDKKHLLREGYQQLQDLLMTNMQSELDLIIKETNLTEALSQLDALQPPGSRNDENIEQEQYNSQDQVRQSTMALKMTARENYKEMLEKTLRENDRLAETVAIRRQRLLDTNEQVNRKLADLSKAASSCEAYCLETGALHA